MEPALSDGDYVVTLTLRTATRGQVVVFEHPGRPGFHLVKRIVGLPGEVVSITDGAVAIDGEPLEDRWTTTITPGNSSWTVPLDSVFVLGDARTMSNDSRALGPIEISSCRRVVLRYWPRPGGVS